MFIYSGTSGHIGTDHFVDYRSVLPLYALDGIYNVQTCPLFRVSFIRGLTVHFTCSHAVEDGLWSQALAVSARQVRLVSCDHLPQNYTETVHVTAGCVARAWDKGGREGGRGEGGRGEGERGEGGREGGGREGGREGGGREEKSLNTHVKMLGLWWQRSAGLMFPYNFCLAKGCFYRLSSRFIHIAKDEAQ